MTATTSQDVRSASATNGTAIQWHAASTRTDTGSTHRGRGESGADESTRPHAGSTNLHESTRPHARSTNPDIARAEPMHEVHADELDDGELLARFEALTLEPACFRHREHVRLAFAVLACEGELDRAALRFRRALRAFAASLGAAGRYHETITWAYLAIVNERMHLTPCATSSELLDRHPDLLDHRTGALSRYYDVASITASPLARTVFVLPNR